MSKDIEKMRGLWGAALRKSVPSWFPQEMIDAQVDRLLEDGVQKSDYESLDVLKKSLADYVRDDYNPRAGKGQRIPDPQGYASGFYSDKATPLQIASLQDKVAEGKRFNQNVDAFFPSTSKVSFPREVPKEARGTVGYVEREGENNKTAFIRGNPASFPEVVPHELEHTRQNTPSYINPDEAVHDELVSLVKDLEPFQKEKKLPPNAFDSARELIASLIGIEANLKEGESVLDNPVLSTVLSEKYPKARDWYFQNRFATGAFNKGTK